MRVLKFILRFIVFCILTIFTQIGGLIYLINFSTHKIIDKKIGNKWIARLYKLTSFLVLYCFATFIIVPLLAKPFGRVQLPIMASRNLQPYNFMSGFFNRNYVKPELRNIVFEVADEMNKKYPGTIIKYLDANFPFINGFILFPHQSHNDGQKLDLAYCYDDTRKGQPTNEVPVSFMGYGICQEPNSLEYSSTEECEGKGYILYSMLMKVMPKGDKANFSLNEQKTKELVSLFATRSDIHEIFIEPYLKTRLKLDYEKIHFQGCISVRHDDHFHIQLN